eukprot:PhF_6_TR36084/c0_g1_i1/m.52422
MPRGLTSFFSLGTNSVACDLTVTDPSCISVVSAAAVQPGLAADTVAASKIMKHEASVRELGHKFYPWACETFGHIDKRLVNCLRTLSLELPQFMRRHFVKDTILSLST